MFYTSDKGLYNFVYEHNSATHMHTQTHKPQIPHTEGWHTRLRMLSVFCLCHAPPNRNTTDPINLSRSAGPAAEPWTPPVCVCVGGCECVCEILVIKIWWRLCRCWGKKYSTWQIYVVKLRFQVQSWTNASIFNICIQLSPKVHLKIQNSTKLETWNVTITICFIETCIILTYYVVFETARQLWIKWSVRSIWLKIYKNDCTFMILKHSVLRVCVEDDSQLIPY